MLWERFLGKSGYPSNLIIYWDIHDKYDLIRKNKENYCFVHFFDNVFSLKSPTSEYRGLHLLSGLTI